MKKSIRIGTRGSPLALIQANQVSQKLLTYYQDLSVEIVPIKTGGDWRPEQRETRFIDMGGNKGLFSKEIEEALLARHIDIAVHSMKDVVPHLPDELMIAAMLPRIDPRDAFISAKAPTLDALPAGSVIGTSSLRRQAQILARRPDLQIVPLRGNVDTRLQKLANGAGDATLLAVAGLQRLGMTDRIASVLEIDVMLPAAAQGAIGVEIRRDDQDLLQFLQPLGCAETMMCVGAERAVLAALDGSCKTPAGVLAQLQSPNQLRIEGLVVMPDGTKLTRKSVVGSVNDGEAMGRALGLELRTYLPSEFFMR